MKKVLIIAGEASGDLHGSLLMEEMNSLNPGIEFRGIGGPLMQSKGLDAVVTIDEMNIMGFIEVLRHLGSLRKTMSRLEHILINWMPDLVILIDYPGFNLRFAKKAKSRGVKVMYYISPQLWAWHKSRVEVVRRYVDKMVVLFDFEKDFYSKHGIEAVFVGHPLLDVVRPGLTLDRFRKSLGISPGKKIIGLIPGSRPNEINKILPSMALAAEELLKKYDTYCLIAGAPGIKEELYHPIIKNSRTMLVKNKTYDIMAHSDVLAVASGTATIEAGILGTPMVIVYRTSSLSYFIGKMLIDVDNIGMVNIVAGKRIVPELWQNEVAPGNIANHLEKYLTDGEELNRTKEKLRLATSRLGSSGAAKRAASIASEMLV